MAQLLLADPALLCVNRQRHNTVETVANPDFIGNTVQPPVIEIPLNRPAAPPLLLDNPPLIPIRVFLLRLGQREPPLPHEAQEPLLLPVTVRYKLQQLLQRHPPAKPIGRHGILPAQFGTGTDHTKALQNALNLRLLDGGGVPVPYLTGKRIFQLLQAFLIIRVHRERFLQHII